MAGLRLMEGTMKNKLMASLVASILLSYSGLSLASSYSPIVGTINHKIWLQPTLTSVAETIDDGGWIWANNNDVAGLFDHYTGLGPNSSGSEADGSFYFKFAGTQTTQSFFNDFIPTRYYEIGGEGTGLFHTSLRAMTSNSNSTVSDDYMYTYFAIGSSAFSSQLKWLYKVSPVPIPAAAFLFAPALLGFMGLRRKAKNSAA
jgi:hypothetical protein